MENHAPTLSDTIEGSTNFINWSPAEHGFAQVFPADISVYLGLPWGHIFGKRIQSSETAVSPPSRIQFLVIASLHDHWIEGKNGYVGMC